MADSRPPKRIRRERTPVRDAAFDKGCVFSGLRPAWMCGGPAVLMSTVGCVHEHVYTDVPICQYHVEEVAAGDSYCRACFDHDGHDCPLLADPRAVRVLEVAHLDVFGEVAHA